MYNLASLILICWASFSQVLNRCRIWNTTAVVFLKTKKDAISCVCVVLVADPGFDLTGVEGGDFVKNHWKCCWRLEFYFVIFGACFGHISITILILNNTSREKRAKIIKLSVLDITQYRTDERESPQEAQPARENSSVGFIEAVHQ